jgi:NitT/TauT family transport system permease protein/sulfonate transport system permease protein
MDHGIESALPVARREKGSGRGRSVLLQGLGAAVAVIRGFKKFSLTLALFILWELSVRVELVNRDLFPPPMAVGRSIVQLAQLGILWTDIQASVLRITIGFLIASAIAMVLAIVLARSDRLAFYCMPIIDLVRPISVIAWIPLAILWFGLGNKPAWFIIFLGSFFPIFTNTYVGIRSVEHIHVQVAECLGAGRWLFVREVLFPSALPFILTGMRIGLGVGWMCVIAAEMIAATSGLGYMIQLARSLIETEKVIGGMIVIGIIGFAMNQLMLYVERKLTPWRYQGG